MWDSRLWSGILIVKKVLNFFISCPPFFATFNLRLWLGQIFALWATFENNFSSMFREWMKSTQINRPSWRARGASVTWWKKRKIFPWHSQVKNWFWRILIVTFSCRLPRACPVAWNNNGWGDYFDQFGLFLPFIGAAEWPISTTFESHRRAPFDHARSAGLQSPSRRHYLINKLGWSSHCAWNFWTVNQWVLSWRISNSRRLLLICSLSYQAIRHSFT